MSYKFLGINIPIFSKGYGRISDPEKYISENYGKDFQRIARKRIENFLPLDMGDYPFKKHCVITSVASLVFYYKNIGLIEIHLKNEEIFYDICLYAKRHLYYFEFYGVNLFAIPALIRGVFKHYGYKVRAKNSTGLKGGKLSFEIAEREIEEKRPFLLSFSGGDYQNHTTVCYGYDDYICEGERIRLLTVADNWTRNERFADSLLLGSFNTTFYAITEVHLHGE